AFAGETLGPRGSHHSDAATARTADSELRTPTPHRSQLKAVTESRPHRDLTSAQGEPMAYQKFETDLAGQALTIETGHVAEQANGALIIRCGDTVLLVTATASKQPREGIDFFPLTCDYEEKLYAAGRIPGSFPRREGRPSEAAVL